MLKWFMSIIVALTLGPALAQETKAPQPILPDMPSAATPQTGEMAKPAFPLPDKKPVQPPPVVVKAPPAKAAAAKEAQKKETPKKEVPKKGAPSKGASKKPPPPKPVLKKKAPTKKAR